MPESTATFEHTIYECPLRCRNCGITDASCLSSADDGGGYCCGDCHHCAACDEHPPCHAGTVYDDVVTAHNGTGRIGQASA